MTAPAPATTATATPLLALRGLTVATATGTMLLHGLDLDVRPGETVGIVGESGSGKSLTMRAALGILPAGLTAGGDVDRTPRVAMIFQEPATALNPTMRIGTLLTRVWTMHHPGTSRAAARAAAIDLLDRVGIPDPERRLKAWPHELSGGMRQRVMIAAALATEPDLLLCDEPTTALDVRVQAQILALLRELVADRGMALVFVSHDLAVVSELCERLVVMRRGEVVEEGPLGDVVTAPAHEYTRELLAANLARRIGARGTETA